MRKARLREIAYIPQGAMNSLNPVMRIGAQMVDAMRSPTASALRARAARPWSRRSWTASTCDRRVPHVSRTSSAAA